MGSTESKMKHAAANKVMSSLYLLLLQVATSDAFLFNSKNIIVGNNSHSGVVQLPSLVPTVHNITPPPLRLQLSVEDNITDDDMNIGGELKDGDEDLEVKFYKLKFYLGQVKAELETSNLRTASAEQQISDLNKRVTELSKQRDDLNQEKEKLQSEMKANNNNNSGTLSSALVSADIKQNDMTDLKDSLQTVQSKLAAMESQLDSTREELEATKEILKEERLKHESELQKLETVIREKMNLEFKKRLEDELEAQLKDHIDEAQIEEQLRTKLEAEISEDWAKKFRNTKSKLQTKYEDEQSILLEEIAKLNMELTGLESTFSENEKKLEEIEKKTSSDRDVIQKLEELKSVTELELKTVKVSYAKLEKQKEDDLRAINMAANALNIRYADLETKYIKTVKLLKRARLAYEEFQVKYENDIAKNAGALSSLEKQKIELITVTSDLEDEVTSLKTEMEAQKNKYENDTKRMDEENEKSKKSLLDQIAQLVSNFDKKEKQVKTEYETKISKNLRTISSLEAEKVELVMKISDLEIDLKSLKIEMEAPKTAIERLKKENDKSEKNFLQQIANMKSDSQKKEETLIKKYESLIEQKETLIAQYFSELNKSKDDLSSKEQELTDMANDYEIKLEKLGSEMDQLRADMLDQMLNIRTDTEVRERQLIRDHQRALTSREMTITDLKKTIQFKNEKIREMEALFVAYEEERRSIRKLLTQQRKLAWSRTKSFLSRNKSRVSNMIRREDKRFE